MPDRTCHYRASQQRDAHQNGSGWQSVDPQAHVEDAAILYDIISGHDEKDSTSAPKNDKVSDKLDANRKLKIAVLPKHIENASTDVKNAYEKATKII